MVRAHFESSTTNAHDFEVNSLGASYSLHGWQVVWVNELLSSMYRMSVKEYSQSALMKHGDVNLEWIKKAA